MHIILNKDWYLPFKKVMFLNLNNDQQLSSSRTKTQLSEFFVDLNRIKTNQNKWKPMTFWSFYIYSLVQRFVYTFDAVWSKFDPIPHQKCIQFTGPNCMFTPFRVNIERQLRKQCFWMEVLVTMPSEAASKSGKLRISRCRCKDTSPRSSSG